MNGKDPLHQTAVRPLHNYEVLGQQMIIYLRLTYGREPTPEEFEEIWNAFDDAVEKMYE